MVYVSIFTKSSPSVLSGSPSFRPFFKSWFHQQMTLFTQLVIHCPCAYLDSCFHYVFLQNWIMTVETMFNEHFVPTSLRLKMRYDIGMTKYRFWVFWTSIFLFLGIFSAFSLIEPNEVKRTRNCRSISLCIYSLVRMRVLCGSHQALKPVWNCSTILLWTAFTVLLSRSWSVWRP